MKDILIISHFCRDFSKTDNGRFMYLCKELAKDNNVEIVTSDFSHASKIQKEPLTEKWPFKITFLHESGYKRNISIQRFFSHASWGKQVRKYLNKRQRPDVVYCAIPSLTAPYFVSKYCKKNNVKFIIDVQDIWPEAFKLAFNIPVISDVLFLPFNLLANASYKRADEICGVSQTYVDRALSVNKNVSSGHVVFLGTNLETFDNNAEKNRVHKDDHEVWIGYCGTLGASYDITVVIDALSIVKTRGKKQPKFIVLGDGERRVEFETHAKNLGVDSVFTGRLPYDQMCGWLSLCDIVANPIQHNAAQSIINKHGDYASSGNPVINTQESDEYRKLIVNYEMGYNVSNGDAEGFADRIIDLIEDENKRRIMGMNARRCALERFDRRHTYIELVNVITGNQDNDQ